MVGAGVREELQVGERSVVAVAPDGLAAGGLDGRGEGLGCAGEEEVGGDARGELS